MSVDRPLFMSLLPTHGFFEQRGPESRAELDRWDAWIIEVLKSTDQGYLASAHEILQGGLLYYSDYSGMDFPMEAMRVLARAMSMERLGGEDTSYNINAVRVSDKGGVQIDVLKKQSRWLHGGRLCVLGDLFERMSSKGRQWVEEAAPEKSADPAIANCNIAEFFSKNKQWLFDAGTTSYCHVHRRHCPAYPGQAMYNPSQFEDMGKQAEAVAKKPKLQRHDSVSGGSAWYHSLQELGIDGCDQDSNRRRPLIFNVSGVTCVDYSCLGRQKRQAGQHQRYHDWYILEREMLARANLEDFFMTECSDRYPAETLQTQRLGDTHEIHIVRVSPQDLGFPIRRRRSFTFGLNKTTMVWTGPKDDAETQARFLSMFRRTVEMSGDCFFYAQWEDIESSLCDRVTKRKTLLPPDFKRRPVSEFLHVLLPRTALERKAVYDSKQGELGGLGGAFLVDLEQSCQTGCTPSQLVPTLNTHSEIFSYESQRLAVEKELFYMQGVDSDSAVSNGRGVSPLMACVQHLNSADVRLLTGNGIHMATWGAWWLFCLSNCARREVPSACDSRPLARPTDDTDKELANDE